MSYPYDPQTRDYVARLLYGALPAMYRVQDEAPQGHEELKRFLAVLAAPLAALRQNVEELHADLFIDTAHDWVLPYLADMVGTTLIFPDADRNRRDVRETVGWRKRKGTPSMLQEMGSLLAERLVVTREGWKLVQMTQDLDLLRRERRLPDLTDARIAETVSGPLVVTHHTVDVRAITERTGKFHPRHVFHWLHPTLCFPLAGGTPADLRDPLTDPDLRFAFHPLGELLPLRARRTDERDPLPTDRIPPLHFA
ncbi:MAG: phage tail protein, partial [Thermoanaerobaculia bacterium]